MNLKIIVTALACLAAVPAVAQMAANRSESVKFEPGASSATLTSTVKGYEVVDYAFSARAGQTLKTSISGNGSLILTVMLPSGEAYDNATMVDKYEGKLDHTGDYKIRVGLMRNEARREVAVPYKLAIAIQ